MPTITLPGNLHVEAINPVEAELIYREIFELETYAQCGISLKAGDCVFDIGANIGLYTLHLAQSYADLRIFAFEPMPAVFSILKCNAASHAPEARLFNVGLGAQQGKATFEYNPHSTITASMRPADFAGAVQRDAKWWQWLQAGLTDLYKIGRLPARLIQLNNQWLAIPVLRWILFIPFAIYVLLTTVRNRRATQRINCPITTISAIIRENNLDYVQLLKIDVEGGEADVIAGIELDDWAKIGHLVVEVHDVKGRVDKLRTLLESQHYRVQITQEDWALHRLLGIFTLYATREAR